MILYKCDRCGREIEDGATYPFGKRSVEITFNQHPQPVKYDYCAECLSLLGEFMKPPKAVA